MIAGVAVLIFAGLAGLALATKRGRKKAAVKGLGELFDVKQYRGPKFRTRPWRGFYP